MAKDERQVFLSGRLPASLHRRLMATLKLQGKSWQEIMRKFAEDYVEKYWKGKTGGNGK